MMTTDKTVCRNVAALLAAHGVRHAVVSPGSRNAPLITAIDAEPQIETHVVVDERSAGFVALGIADITGQPVALCCTSGTALLNYAPAVAEAYYRALPLVVVSGDRPQQWIDQDDSQTLQQERALEPWVKAQWTIPDTADLTADLRWMANRCVNDALLAALAPRRGPVHINVRLDAPLGGTTDAKLPPPRVIGQLTPQAAFPKDQIQELSRVFASSKTLIVAGFMPPNGDLNRMLSRLAKSPNVVVLTETVANLHSPDFLPRVDATLRQLGHSTCSQPDLVVTIGGALISRHLKEYLRGLPTSARHWAVGRQHTTVDCFRRLSLRVDADPCSFFRSLRRVDASLPPREAGEFSYSWKEAALHAATATEDYAHKSPFCDFTAMRQIIAGVPQGVNVQLSNGTSIRYAQLFDCSRFDRCDCNRGVSGIDGCTSTAIGAATAYPGATLLITGDMSAQYDIGALGIKFIPPTFRMVVLCNGGGGIFRFVASTRSLPQREAYFGAGPMRLPILEIARAYGFEARMASTAVELEECLKGFYGPSPAPRLLAVRTDPEISARVLSDYFKA